MIFVVDILVFHNIDYSIKHLINFYILIFYTSSLQEYVCQKLIKYYSPKTVITFSFSFFFVGGLNILVGVVNFCYILVTSVTICYLQMFLPRLKNDSLWSTMNYKMLISPCLSSLVCIYGIGVFFFVFLAHLSLQDCPYSCNPSKTGL